jgi:hypothetical protein
MRARCSFAGLAQSASSPERVMTVPRYSRILSILALAGDGAAVRIHDCAEKKIGKAELELT